MNRAISTHTTRSSTHETGFTLIELLVVIAIISILASILFPVFSKAREKGRQTVCMSNNRQLNMAYMQYEQDYDESLPNATDGITASSRLGGWVYYSVFPATQTYQSFDVSKGSLYAYVKDKQVYICPSDSIGKYSGLSYAANSCVFVSQTTGFERGKSLAAFDAPSSFMLLGEEATFTNQATSSTDDGYLQYLSNAVSSRHVEGSVISFVDGHAKWFRPEQIAAAAYQTGGVQMPQCP